MFTATKYIYTYLHTPDITATVFVLFGQSSSLVCRVPQIERQLQCIDNTKTCFISFLRTIALFSNGHFNSNQRTQRDSDRRTDAPTDPNSDMCVLVVAFDHSTSYCHHCYQYYARFFSQPLPTFAIFPLTRAHYVYFHKARFCPLFFSLSLCLPSFICHSVTLIFLHSTRFSFTYC